MGGQVSVGFSTFFVKKFPVEFIVRNLSNRVIKVFTHKIYPNATVDLMSISFVSEADIAHSLLKGDLYNLLNLGVISVVRSNVSFAPNDSQFAAFLISHGMTATTDFFNISAAEDIHFRTAQDGGWRDMTGQPVAQQGQAFPAWTQMGTGPFYAYKFDVGDLLWFSYHFQHDYSLGTSVLLHAHWVADGIDTNPVNWEFSYTYAKGHNQDNYDMTGTVITVQEAAPGNAPWRHMTTEITSEMNADYEPDGILLVRLKRITNGATDNTDAVFLLEADCHYKANTIATKNRTPNFYT